MKLQYPHDKFFKESLGNVETAKDFIANYLPKQVLPVLKRQHFNATKRQLH